MLAALLFGLGHPSSVEAKSKKQKQIAEQLFVVDTNKNPLAEFWNDPQFVKQVMGSYGMAAPVEPSMNTEETAFYKEKLVPLMAEDPMKAAQELENYIKPDSSASFDFVLGTVYFQHDLLTNAVRHLEAAVAKFPSFRRAHKNLGYTLVRSQRFEEAIPHLTKTLELGGADSYTYGLLGGCYLRLERYYSAEAAYKHAMLFAPDNIDWKLGLIQCLSATENFKPALQLINELLQHHPDKENLWVLQSGIYLQLDELDEAAVNLEILRKMGKADVKNLMLLGDIYMTQDSREMALPAYLEAIEKEGPADLSRALRAADILAGRGAWDEAQVLFKRIHQLSGNNLAGPEKMKLLKLESKVAMATGNGTNAIQVLEEITRENPMDGEALLLAGDYYAGVDEREKAENRYILAAKIPEFETEAWVKHAQLLVKYQNYAGAVDLLRKAQRAHPRENVARFLEKVEEAALRAGRQ